MTKQGAVVSPVWVDSNIFDPSQEPEKSYERTRAFLRDPRELLDGCSVREIDIDLDTIPGQLLDLIESRR